MTALNQVYKCEVCGNIIEMLHTGVGELVCCGQTMKLQQEKHEEEGFTEKHRPVIEELEDGAAITIGAVEHPMTEEHYIEWVEVLEDNKLCRHKLKPGDKPTVRSWQKDHSYVRAYCNVHGLWKN